MKTGPRRLIGVLLLTPLWLACGAKKINEILADPQQYANQDVTVEGEVVESYSIVGRGGYRIEDGTGSLCIYSERGVPRQGAQVSVKGRVREGFNLGSILSLPQRFCSGLVLVESSHRASN